MGRGALHALPLARAHALRVARVPALPSRGSSTRASVLPAGRRAAVASGLALALSCLASSAHAADDETSQAPTVLFGGRVTTTNVRAKDQSATSYGALFVTSAGFNGSSGKYGSIRGSFIGAIGSGTATVEGWLRGALTLGLSLPITHAWSGFLRAGFGGELQGNGNYYFSRLELPVVETGLQLRDGDRLMEAGIRGAPVLAGRYHVEGARPRNLATSPQYGAYFSARTQSLRSEVSAMIIDSRGDGYDRPVHLFRALLCGFGIAGALVVCGDGEVIRVPNGGMPVGELSGSRVFYMGLTIGVGQTFRPPGDDP